jgi:hypothetical protein
MKLVVFRLTERRLELLIISVHLFRLLHCVASTCITAGRYGIQWTKPKVSMLIPQKLKCLLLFLDVIRLQFLDYKSRLQLFLIVRKYGQGK